MLLMTDFPTATRSLMTGKPLDLMANLSMVMGLRVTGKKAQVC
jgi:hypothetical protein